MYVHIMNDKHFVSHVCETWKRSVPTTKCHSQMWLFVSGLLLVSCLYNRVTHLSSAYFDYLRFVALLIHTRWLSPNNMSHILSLL